MESISQHAKNKKKFLDSFYRGTYETSKFKTSVKYRKLSNAVGHKSNIAKDALDQLKEIVRLSKTSQSLNLLIFFSSSNQNTLTPAHIEFLKKLYIFLISASKAARP